MSWLRIRELVRKEFIQLFRDKKNRPLLVIAPLVQLIVFGYVVTTDVRDIRVGLIDQSRTPESRRLIQAIDASPEGLAKVARKYRAVCRASDRSPACVALLTIEQLGLAMGRANVVHAALSDGKAADNFLAAAMRLEKYRAVSPDRSAFVDARTVAVG